MRKIISLIFGFLCVAIIVFATVLMIYATNYNSTNNSPEEIIINATILNIKDLGNRDVTILIDQEGKKYTVIYATGDIIGQEIVLVYKRDKDIFVFLKIGVSMFYEHTRIKDSIWKQTVYQLKERHIA